MPLGIGKLLHRLAPGKVHEEELQPGSTVKNYTVLKRLGAGQYAVVSALQAPLLADPRSCGGASLRGGPRCCQVAQIGSWVHWDVSSGRKSQGHFLPPPPLRRRRHPPGSCLRAAYDPSPRSPVHPPLAQVYMVQAPDGHVFALKQERFGKMSQADRRGWHACRSTALMHVAVCVGNAL